MNLNGRSALDPRWVGHHTKVVASFMTARVRAIRKNPDVIPTYNQATGEWSGDFDVIWEGNARIQPYGIIGDQVVAQDTTGRRLMRAQIEDKESGIQLDDMIIIEECGYNPELCNYTLEVRGSIGSSNSWVTDLVCEANLKG